MFDFTQPLADVIKRAREHHELTQTQLAEQINIDTRTVLNIENCKGNPNMQVLFPLIRTLNVDPNDIFYPERLKQNSKRNDLHLLVDTCSEQEAAALIAIIDSILKVMRNQGPTNLQK